MSRRGSGRRPKPSMRPSESVEAVASFVIENGALYDTEIVNSTLSHVVFFANTRRFLLAGTGEKEQRKHTNLLGNGGTLPVGHAMVIRAVRVEIEGPPGRVEIAKGGYLTLMLYGGRIVDAVPIREAMRPDGHVLEAPREIVGTGVLEVTWARPVVFGKRLSVKVTILGRISLPLIDDEWKEKMIAAYTDRAPAWRHVVGKGANRDCGKIARRMPEGHWVCECGEDFSQDEVEYDGQLALEGA